MLEDQPAPGLAPVAAVLDHLDPARAAVLVIDLQNDFCHRAGAMAAAGADVSSSERVLARLGPFLDAARRSGASVGIVTLAAATGPIGLEAQLVEASTGRPAGRVCRVGTWGAALHPDVAVAEEDFFVVKRRYSAFAGTDLETTMRRRGLDHVVVVGTTANVCIQATAMDAYLRGFGVVVVRDLVGYTRRALAEAALANLSGYYGLVCTAEEVVAAWGRRAAGRLAGHAGPPAPAGAALPPDGTAPAVGVVVPPENPTVEPELASLLGTAVCTYTARLPVRPGDLAARLVGYNDSMADAVDSFGRLELSAVLVACTGSSYRLGPSGDEDLRRSLVHRRGHPVATSTTAVRAALANLGHPSVALVTPYPEWLTDEAVAYYRNCGIDVAEVNQLATGPGGIYGLSGPAVAAEIATHAFDRSAVVLFTGTGMPTLDAISALGAHGVVAISSNLCGAWWLASQVLPPGTLATDARLHPELRRLASLADPGGPGGGPRPTAMEKRGAAKGHRVR